MPREDILVSVCIHDVPITGDRGAVVQRFESLLSGEFRYWEILIAVPPDASPGWETAFQAVRNLRILRLRPGLGSYDIRAALAAEAIGDVVCLASAKEVEFIDINQMIVDAHQQHSLVIGDRGKASVVDSLLAIVGNSSGFKVSARYMQTVACPRDLLTRLLSQPDYQLALRYPPRDSAFTVRFQPARKEFHENVRRGALAGRLILAQRLMVSSAPNVLMALSLGSALLALSTFAFLFYVLGVWIWHDSVQPGWVTTSGILGVSGVFLGLLGLGLSTGMQKIIALVGRNTVDDVMEEVSAVNIYSGIGDDLNVHYEFGPEHSEPSMDPKHDRS